MEKQKILFFDVETSTLRVSYETYQLKQYSKYIDPKHIERDWHMLGAAWKWQGEDSAQVVSVSPSDPLNDEGVIRALYGVLQEADILVGHNSDAFDIKKFNTRAIAYDLPPLAQKTQIDTLKIARKYFKFTSNRLSFLADFLNVPQGKDESPDWSKCLAGCPDELRYMRKYNKQDVYVTEAIYDKLMAWHHTHPAIYSPARDADNKIVDGVCPYCASPNTKKEGFRMSNTGKFKHQRHRCNDCGKFFKGERINL